MKNFSKNLFIAFLMILAIYQTTELWFEEYSSHNFFSFISAGSLTGGQNAFYGINRLIISLGDNKAICRSENVLDTSYRADFDKLIANAVSKGEAADAQIDWTHLFNNRCVIYDISNSISSDDFTKALGISQKQLILPDNIDMVLLIPNTTENVVQTYVSGSGKTVCFSLKRGDLAQKGIDAIAQFTLESDDLNYISSRGNGFNIFSSNTFIPTPRGTQSTIDVINPAMDGERIDTKALEALVSGFFENPAVKWSSVVNNVYSYSDENNVVKYNLNGVLEYSGYNASDEQSGEKTDLMKSYAAAEEFLKKDIGIENSVVLTSIAIQDDKPVFCFDYTFNDLPVYLSDELKAGLGLRSAIEVTVSKGSVVRMRRYMCTLKSGSEKQTVETDFVKAVDNVYNIAESEDTVDSVELVYKINGRQENVPLCWRVDMGGKSYWEKA
ncbi:MAG: hypothetical protein IJR45_00975 [Firmicutes bacterium]|nr:hypothetical protein [Bacillota bacterium]